MAVKQNESIRESRPALNCSAADGNGRFQIECNIFNREKIFEVEYKLCVSCTQSHADVKGINYFNTSIH